MMEEALNKTDQKICNPNWLLLPEEIWLLILDEVKANKDLKNCTNVCTLLRRLLSDRRTEFLFSQVWNETLAEVLTDRMSNKEVLQLRRVCPSWRAAIDNTLESMGHPTKSPAVISLSHEIEYNFVATPFTRPTRFLRYFKSSHGTGIRSPFISNSVSLKSDFELPSSISPFVKILKLYGKHVRHLAIKTTDETSQFTQFYMYLQRFLILTPNLISLSIYCNWAGLTLGEKEEFEVILRRNPLPTLKNLDYLLVVGMPTQIFHEVLQRNGQNLTGLQVDLENEEDADLSILPPTPNLTDFSLTINNEKMIEQLQNSDANWRLEKIRLLFLTEVPWFQIFRALNSKWAETLTNVTLYLPQRSNEDDAILPTLRLNLPKVTSLSIKFSGQTMLDFILPMKCLEDLAIDLNLYYDNSEQIKENEKRQQIQFLGYFDKMMESNIWQLFPKLNFLGISYGAMGNIEYKTYDRK